MPIDVTFRGELPVFDKGKEINDHLPNMTILFQIKPAKHKSLPPKLVLCIPESYIPHIIYLYHDNILGGHQGVDRMYWTIREKFYFPNMLPCIHKYVLCCQTCLSNY